MTGYLDMSERELQRHWGRPEPRKQGDLDPDRLFSAVGQALTNWEHVEQELAQLFMILISCDSPRTSETVRRAFGAIEFNTGRRRAIEAAAEVFFGHHWNTAKKDLDKLLKHVETGSRRRDDIAHGRVMTISTEGTYRGGFLMPPEYNTGRTYLSMNRDSGEPLDIYRAKYRFIAADVLSFASKFWELREETIRYFLSIIPNDGVFSPEFLERQKAPQRSRR
jgi:hypothetical protein